MGNPYFRFKEFTIIQDKTAMKVGVDGVLLGAWACINNAVTILDIGTGTGLLSLMLAQKSEANITAIELEKNSYLQAKENIERSKWGDRIKVINASIQRFTKNTINKFDLIICNPPYFKDSLNSKDKLRNFARHDNKLPIEDLLKCVQELLDKNGRFIMIFPFDRMYQLLNLAQERRLYPNQLLKICGTQKKEPNRVIIEFSFKEISCNVSSLIVRDFNTNDYTSDYKNITKDYYLAF